MKTAISIPDTTFEEAEEVAKDLGISRSELYRRALEKFLGEYQGRAVTDALNDVYAEESSELDPVLAKMQFASTKREDW